MKTGTLTRVALCLVAGMALGPWGADEAGAQATEITVVLPNPSAINVFPLWVAIGEGYFEDEGLEVNVEAVDGSSQVLQALSAGQAQIGCPGPRRSWPPAPAAWTWSSSTTISPRAYSAWWCARSRPTSRPPT